MDLNEIDNLIRASRVDVATKRLLKEIKSKKATIEVYRRAIEIASSQQNIKEVVRLYKSAMMAFPSNPDLKNQYLQFCLQKEVYDEAIKFLAKLLKHNPNNVDAELALADCYIKTGQAQKSTIILNKLNENGYAREETYRLLGDAYVELDKPDEAFESFKQAVKQFKPTINTVASFLNHCDRTNRQKEIAELISDLDEEIIKAPGVLFHLAAFYSREKEFDKAEACYKDFFQHRPTVSAQAYTKAIYEHGFLLDKMGKYQDAIVAFQTANDFAFQMYGQDAELTTIETVELLKKLKVEGESSFKAPVFVIGFLRSGTTLVDQVLSTNKTVQVFEETPVLGKVFINNLKSIRKGRILSRKKMQKAFFDYYKKDYGWTGDRLLIDRSAPNMIYLNFIREIFPEAKIVILNRHPLDIILSCYMQFFVPSSLTRDFMKLNEIAKVFNHVMADVPLRAKEDTTLTIKYEDLVSDFENTTKELFSFLDLEWSDKTSEFYKVALEKKQIQTASYHQVVQPLYNNSLNRWKNYDLLLSPYYETLRGITEKLGYQI
ncbi:MAG: sulfotransferase [Methylocystaceae bacterium]|nr:sulfotransferase [Methylocystaceae bacterium]